MMMFVVRRVAPLALVILALLATAVPSYGQELKAFPRVRLGSSLLVTSGGGTVAGTPYVTRSALIVWNRRQSDLTLLLLWRRGVTCKNVSAAASKPGNRIQAAITTPHVTIGRPITPDVAFVTVFRKKGIPDHVSGIRVGARLVFQHIDSYPGGVWQGTFVVPTKRYADSKVYGYKGTFAAHWCDITS